jgi:hypothetical protein
MRTPFASMPVRRKEAALTLAILGMLVGVALVPPTLYSYRPHENAPAKKVLRTLKKRGLNREATAKQTAGYYEGLLDQAAEVTRVGGRGLLDWRFWFVERRQRARVADQVKRERPDFLRFDLAPNTNVAELDERRRLITNSVGLADREYTQRPPPGTWRLALVGDSVSRGMGAEFGTSFETRLERRLNAMEGNGGPRVEILNFSMQGYQLTQFVDVALMRAPEFEPHAYLVALTDRSVFRVWADHIASLVQNDVDLKYDYLRRIAREAGLTPNMSSPLINARLAPYRLDVMRWALSQMHRQARDDGGELVVLLVPTPDDAEMQIEQFEVVKPLLAQLGIPTIDLLETFAYTDDLTPFRVSAADRHPNEEGHRLLFEALWKQIARDARLRTIFAGPNTDNFWRLQEEVSK